MDAKAKTTKARTKSQRRRKGKITLPGGEEASARPTGRDRRHTHQPQEDARLPMLAARAAGSDHAAFAVGQTFRQPERQTITGQPVSPRWFALLTMPQGEAKAQAWLAVHGVESWYPTEVAWRIIPRAKRKQKYLKRIAPGYLFARFEAEPNWPAIRYSRHKLRVVSIDGNPAPISDATMAEMQAIPDRLAEIKQRAIEARTIRPGDRATIRDGFMAGWAVDVSEIHDGIAQFIVPILGETVVKIPVARLAKTQPLAP